VARALIVGCGCRGRLLGEGLLEAGWAVRGTSRTEAGLGAIEAAGIESAIADPDRPASILELVADVAVVYYLLGSARGGAALLADIHGPRLERLLEHLVDTPVRGFAYEAAGTVDGALLEGGAELVRSAGALWRIPYELLRSESDQAAGWAATAGEAAFRLLSPSGEGQKSKLG
jgi:uncharacterized protein YbjT (DUF2867 family)